MVFQSYSECCDAMAPPKSKPGIHQVAADPALDVDRHPPIRKGSVTKRTQTAKTGPRKSLTGCTRESILTKGRRAGKL